MAVSLVMVVWGNRGTAKSLAYLTDSQANLVKATQQAIEKSSFFCVETVNLAMKERDDTMNRMFQLASTEMLQDMVRKHGVGMIVTADGMVEAQLRAYQRRLGLTEDEAKAWIAQSIYESNNGQQDRPNI